MAKSGEPHTAAHAWNMIEFPSSQAFRYSEFGTGGFAGGICHGQGGSIQRRGTVQAAKVKPSLQLDPVSLHPHWGSLFGNGPKSIIPLLRNDTTSDIRMAAVQALKEILRKSSAYIGLVSTQ